VDLPQRQRREAGVKFGMEEDEAWGVGGREVEMVALECGGWKEAGGRGCDDARDAA